jgi:hypothetical protein
MQFILFSVTFLFGIHKILLIIVSFFMLRGIWFLFAFFFIYTKNSLKISFGFGFFQNLKLSSSSSYPFLWQIFHILFILKHVFFSTQQDSSRYHSIAFSFVLNYLNFFAFLFTGKYKFQYQTCVFLYFFFFI